MAPKQKDADASSSMEPSANTSSSTSNNVFIVEEDPIPIFLQILQSPTPFHDDKEESACRQVLEDLTEEEREETAAVSYAYWYLTTATTTQQPPHESNDAAAAAPATRRDHMALKEIRRHYIGESKQHDKTLVAIREALAYRKEYQVNDLRKCFQMAAGNNNNDVDVDEDTGGEPTTKIPSTTTRSSSINDLETLVSQDLEKQLLVTRGYSRTGGGVAYKFGRKALTADTNERGFLLANLYVAERLIAITEYHSRGAQEHIVVAFDFDGYESKYKPPTSVMRIFTTMLQRLYPERLET
jgi:hypothetical protein